MSKDEKIDGYLSRKWNDVGEKSAYGGERALHDEIQRERLHDVSKSRIRKWLRNQDAHALRRQIKRKVRKSSVNSPGIDYLWDADLADVSGLKRTNKGVTFLLVVVDTFSRHAWVVPLKSKTGQNVISAFRSIFRDRKPRLLRTDKGTEFVNRPFKKFLRENDVVPIESLSDHKAAFAESFIGKFKNVMYRYMESNDTDKYLDVLPDLVRNYNDTRHGALHGLAPSQIDEDTQYTWMARRSGGGGARKKRIRFRFKVGDRVRITRKAKTFRRGFLQKWTYEVFEVSHRYRRENLAVYKLRDLKGEEIQGSFSEAELQKVDKTELFTKVEKIVKRRKTKNGKKEVLVRYLGWPSKFDRWMTEREAKRYK